MPTPPAVSKRRTDKHDDKKPSRRPKIKGWNRNKRKLVKCLFCGRTAPSTAPGGQFGFRNFQKKKVAGLIWCCKRDNCESKSLPIQI